MQRSSTTKTSEGAAIIPLGYELAISQNFGVYIQGDSGGNSVIWEVIVSGIIGKNVYIYI